MPGPPPKPASTRARRNKTSTAAVLKADPDGIAPDLPEDRAWHSMTVEWWNDIWRSPMAPEYDDSDKHGLFMLALVVNDFWMAETSGQRRDAVAEIRQQSQRFGLSPLDRRRLQWEVERTEDAQAKGTQRRARQQPTPAPVPAGQATPADPRSVLRAVK